MRRKGMAQRVRRRRLGNSGSRDGALEGALKGLAVQVVSSNDTAARINRQVILGEDPKPRPRLASSRVLALKRVRHLDAGLAGLDVRSPDLTAAAQLRSQSAPAGQRHWAGSDWRAAIVDTATGTSTPAATDTVPSVGPGPRIDGFKAAWPKCCRSLTRIWSSRCHISSTVCIATNLAGSSTRCSLLWRRR